jgi:hypothetical protein
MITHAKLVAADYDSDAYHKASGERGKTDYTMSRSALCEFNRCPSRWKAGYQGKDSDATDYGSLIDCLALSRKRFDEKFAVKPTTYIDVKSGEVKKWNGNSKVCQDWLCEIGTKTPVSGEDFNLALVAVKRLSDDSSIRDYFASSQRQVYCCAVWQDPIGVSVPLKILIDLAPDKLHTEYGKTLGDFKTARNAGNRQWAKQVNDYGYHVQAALYLDVFNAATGEQRNDFRHVIQENVHPYQTAKRYLAREWIIEGRRAYQSALSFYAACLKSNTWPDYDHSANMHINGWACVEQEAWMVKNADLPPLPPQPDDDQGIIP